MIQVRIYIDGLANKASSVDIEAHSNYGPPDEAALDYVIALAVEQAKAALSVDDRR